MSESRGAGYVRGYGCEISWEDRQLRSTTMEHTPVYVRFNGALKLRFGLQRGMSCIINIAHNHRNRDRQRPGRPCDVANHETHPGASRMVHTPRAHVIHPPLHRYQRQKRRFHAREPRPPASLFRGGLFVQPAGENALYGLVPGIAEGKGPCAGPIEPLSAVGVASRITP